MSRVERREVRWHPDVDRLEVRFPYRSDLVDRVREIGGGRFDRERRCWWFSADRREAVGAALGPLGFELDPAIFGTSEAQHVPAPAAPWTVSQLNRNLRIALERAFPSEIRVVAQVVSAQGRAGGHLWMELSDPDKDGATVGRVPAVAFAAQHAGLAERLRTLGAVIEPGLVMCWIAEVTLFERAGRVQLRVLDVDLEWAVARLEDRRQRVLEMLAGERLLTRNLQRPLPALPLRVAVVTSLGSDAWHDVLSTLSESRWPFEILPVDVRVQGDGCVPSVLEAFRHLSEVVETFDVCLLTRGGGSRTDLAVWDDVVLGRAVACAPFKVIVALGHEQDRSVLDEIATSARTPTAGARLLVDRVAEVGAWLAASARRFDQGVHRRLVWERRDLDGQADRLSRSARQSLQAGARWQAQCKRALRPSAHQVLAGSRREHVRLQGRLSRASRRGLAALRQELEHTGMRLSSERLQRHLAGVRLAFGRQARRLRRAGASGVQSHGVDTQRLAAHLQGAAQRSLERSGRAMRRDQEKLGWIDPRRLLEKGFAILRTEEGRVVRDAQTVAEGSSLRAELASGILHVKVEACMRTERARGNDEEVEG